jgi:hypothetical protein
VNNPTRQNTLDPSHSDLKGQWSLRVSPEDLDVWREAYLIAGFDTLSEMVRKVMNQQSSVIGVRNGRS